MDEQYVGKRFKLFKSARDTKVFYVIGAFLCLIVVLHHFDSVIKCCFQKIVNLKQSIDYVKDVSYNYLSSLYYDFSGKSGKIIFRQRNEICRLKAEISRANLIQQENQELRKLLKVKEGSFANIVIAKVISVFDNDFVKSALINCGSDQGIKIDDFVFEEAGLIGRVIEVSETSSKILLITDSNSTIPAKVAGVDCMLSGDNSNLLKISLLGEDVSDGEIVETSNYGSVFREKMPIGKIQKIGANNYVIPFADFSNIKYVCVDRCQEQ
ncbi:MAG: rod shape-determining protein MreC [Alphaproteobacteria bacterium]|nr:rod shape-determining protein MreC [Alphaproteobacteria bacterium]